MKDERTFCKCGTTATVVLFTGILLGKTRIAKAMDCSRVTCPACGAEGIYYESGPYDPEEAAAIQDRERRRPW